MKTHKPVSANALAHYFDYCNKQNGSLFTGSNNVVVCGVIIPNRDKAMDIMDEKGATLRRISHVHIEWSLNNERWVWRRWSPDQRGYRFRKLIVDFDIDEDIFQYIVIKSSGYCYSMEIV